MKITAQAQTLVGNHGNGWQRRLTRATSYSTVHVLQRTVITTARQTEWVILSFILTYLVSLITLQTELQHNWSTSAVESLWPRCLDNETGVTPLSWDKKISRLTIIIIVLIIDLMFIHFVSDHGISGIMPFEASIIRNNWTFSNHFTPLRRVV